MGRSSSIAAEFIDSPDSLPELFLGGVVVATVELVPSVEVKEDASLSLQSAWRISTASDGPEPTQILFLLGLG